MSIPKIICVLFLATAAFCQTSNAQTRSLYKTTYYVKVEYEYVKSSGSEWVTEYVTSNLNDALLVYDLFLVAMDNNELAAMMGYGFGWKAVDVRIITKYERYEWSSPYLQPKISSYR